MFAYASEGGEQGMHFNQYICTEKSSAADAGEKKTQERHMK